jgi:predicted DCC family thiol-disulfide oxidoreductase YuxK
LVIDVEFKIVEGRIPSLLSLKDMKGNMLDKRILSNEIWYEGRCQKLLMINGLLVHHWKPEELPFALLTLQKARKLHRSFGHPSAQKLTNLLRRARPAEGSDVWKTILQITRDCEVCALTAKRPKRFKITIGCEDIMFNHTVAVDVMCEGSSLRGG